MRSRLVPVVLFSKAWMVCLGPLLFVGAAFAASSAFAQRHDAGFPRIALMFAAPGDSLSVEELARYSMIVDGGLIPVLGDNGIAAVRSINPGLISLWHGNMAYVPYNDAILSVSGFQESFLLHFAPSTPSQRMCEPSLRVTFPGWRFPIYAWNLVSDSATSFRERRIVAQFANWRERHPGLYDGVYLDGVHLTPVWYEFYPGRAMDWDCDGIPDDARSMVWTRGSWHRNVGRLLGGIRAAFPTARLVANGAASERQMGKSLASLLDGVEIELALAAVAEHRPGSDWFTDVLLPGLAWGKWGNGPPSTILVGLASYTPEASPSPAALTTARADARRLRFDLGSALLTGSYFVHDYSTYYGRDRQWFDEFDGGGRLGLGYLGQPTSDPVVVDEPEGQDLLSNGSFEVPGNDSICNSRRSTGSVGWCAQYPNKAAMVLRECQGGATDCVLHVSRPGSAAASEGDIQVHQVGVAVDDGQAYSLALRVRASGPSVMAIHLAMDASPWTGVSEYRWLPVWNHWQRFVIPLHVHLPAGFERAPIRLALHLGEASEDVWIEELNLRRGVASLYRRDFERGIVLVNAGESPITVGLGGSFYSLPSRSGAISSRPQRQTTVLGRDAVILLRQPPQD